MATRKPARQKSVTRQPGNTSSIAVSISAATSLRGVQNLVSALAQLGMSATVRMAGRSAVVRSAVASITGRDVLSAVITLGGRKTR